MPMAAQLTCPYFKKLLPLRPCAQKIPAPWGINPTHATRAPIPTAIAKKKHASSWQSTIPLQPTNQPNPSQALARARVTRRTRANNQNNAADPTRARSTRGSRSTTLGTSTDIGKVNTVAVREGGCCRSLILRSDHFHTGHFHGTWCRVRA